MSGLLRILWASALMFSLGCNSPKYFDELKENAVSQSSQEKLSPRDKFDKMAREGKITTTSAQDYCLSNGKDLSKYSLVLVKSPEDSAFNYERDIVNILPKNTEAIAGLYCTDHTCYGTALIPKLDRSKVEKEK